MIRSIENESYIIIIAKFRCNFIICRSQNFIGCECLVCRSTARCLKKIQCVDLQTPTNSITLWETAQSAERVWCVYQPNLSDQTKKEWELIFIIVNFNLKFTSGVSVWIEKKGEEHQVHWSVGDYWLVIYLLFAFQLQSYTWDIKIKWPRI